MAEMIRRRGILNKAAGRIRLALLFLGMLCLSSCYITVQGSRYLALRARAIPADRVLESPDAPESSKELVRRALSIRCFARDELALKDTKNYKAMVEMDADRLATVVSACDSASFHRYLWRYPVVGALPYKGFFKLEEAEREASRLKARDLDVIIRPVDAFSTLGWFSDPLFSFMSRYDDAQLAETIIHELAHATVFVKKAEQFNEEFATFVGRQGALAYVESVFGPDSPQAAGLLRSRKDSDSFAAYLRGTAEALQAVYASDMSREEKLARKATILAERAAEYERTAAETYSEEAYRNFPMEKINNAYLDLYRLYEGEPELYLRFFEKKCQGDLSTFIRNVADLASLGGDPKERMKAALVSD